MSTRRVRFSVLGAALGLLTSAASAATIVDLAPQRTISVVSVDDYRAMRDAFARTGFSSLLDEPEMRDWIGAIASKQQNALRKSLDEANLAMDDLPSPTGSAGIALWLDERSTAPVIFHVMGVLEFGDEADRFERALEALLQRAERNGKAEVVQDDRSGALVREVVLLDDRGQAKRPPASRAASLPHRIHIARRGGVFIASTDRDELGRALDRLAGDGTRSLRDRQDMQRALEQIAPTHLHFAVSMRQMLRAGERVYESDAGGERPSVRLEQMAEAFGISAIRALSYGVEFDAPDAMASIRFGMLAPHRDGVLELFEGIPEGFAPPRFITGDAAQLRMVRFDVSRLLPMINRAIRAMPEQERFSLEALMGFLTASVGPLMQTLGPEIVTTQSIERPFTPESGKTLYALRSRDASAVANAMSQLGQLARLESRRFAGEQVWLTRRGQALSVNAGFLMFGDEETVESALRQPLRGGGVSLDDEARFRRAAALTSPGGFFYTFTDFATVARYANWVDDNWERITRENLRNAGMAERDIARLIERERESRDDRALPPLPDAAVLLRHLGDIVGEGRLHDEGMVARTLWLAPAH